MKFFIALALKRLASRATLTILLIFSIALTVGVLVCVPVFSNAVSMQLMGQELAARATRTNRPAFALRAYALPSGNDMSIQDGLTQRDWMLSLIKQYIGLPVQSVYMQLESSALHLRPVKNDPSNRHQEDELDQVRGLYIPHIEDHIKAVDGIPYGATPAGVPAGTVPIWVETHYAQLKDIRVGDKYRLDGIGNSINNSLPVQVVGLWEASDRQDIFWYRDSITDYDKSFLTTLAIAEQNPQLYLPTSFRSWYFLLDESRINLDRGDQYLNGIESFTRDVEKYIKNGKVDVSPVEELARAQTRKLSLTLILTGFALPLLVMLVFFVISMSTMAARFQHREIALISSRGGTRGQIMVLILIESFIILAVALPLGLVGGLGLATLMGYSVSFLQFQMREPLRVYIESADWRLIAAGLSIGVAARLWATWRASRVSLVAYERQRARTVNVSNGLRIAFVLIMVGLTYYAFRQLSLKGTLGFVSWNVDDASNDPLLLAAPTLFLFTGPLVMVELFVLLMRPIGWLSKLLPSYTAYLGFTQLGREGSQYRGPAYLLILCLTLGVFYASVAKSADIWLVERRRYEVGADLTFQPTVKKADSTTGAPAALPVDADSTAVLPLSDYAQIPGVDHATLVGDFTAIPKLNAIPTVRMLVVDRLSFPQSIYYRRDFAKNQLGDMLNELGMTPNGIIVPRLVLTSTGLTIGDQLDLNLVLADAENYNLTFKIVDTYEYFPTVYNDKPAVIVDANYLNSVLGGTFPGFVWMRLKPGVSGSEVLTKVMEMGVEPVKEHDLGAILQTDQQKLENVGMFGLLSISFVAGALLAAIGILVYSLSSLMERAQRFAIMRAMGMRQVEVVLTVLIEYVITLAYAIAAGLGLGVAASTLYVPLFPVTENPGIPIPPFIAYIDWQRADWMTIAVSIALLLIVAGVVIRVARARIFEVLRMGGWE
ncbi:MAG: ABC transporter permease [Chloroflexi bacterium]|nr:ABC transporter permease [Chloroflexota bacterium]MCL5275220.1 ABC transporter permease [Chloroflexota bacterium]